jgi:hypothetical protein
MGPCYYFTARPQVAEGETASNMEGRCEYIVAKTRQEVVLQLRAWAMC